MQITAIQQAKKDEEKVNIFLDGVFWSSFTKDDLIKFGLHKGLTLNQEEADELKKKSRVSKVKMQAFRHFSGALKSEQDIRTYLYKKELEKEAIEEIVSYLKDHAVINDEYFAERFTDIKIRAKKYSMNRIRAELKKKGVSDRIIKDIPQLRDSDEEIDAIKKYISKNSNLPQEKIIQRLLMRGFKYDVVKKALGKPIVSENDF
jgi:regulatory protein